MAVSKSNRIMACVALMALVCSVPVIASGFWFASAPGEQCARVARWPVAILGGLILLVALAGFVGAYRDHRRLVAFYLVAMGVLIVLLIALLLFGFIVTRGTGAYAVLGRAYDDYGLEGFSMWLRRYVSDDPLRWEGIRSCIADSDTCRKLARQASFVTADQFYMSNLTPIQSGCCKPPSVCGFGYVGPMVWTKPAHDNEQDCRLWSNDPGQLCYECESCRAGLLGTLRSEWHKANIAIIVATIALVLLYLIAWRVYRNAGAIWGRRK